MSFSPPSKADPNEWLTFAIGKALSDRVADKRPRMASLNLGELLRQLKSAYWKLLRFWAVDGQYSNNRRHPSFPIGDLQATKKFRWSYSTGTRQKQTAAQFLYRRGDSHEARST